DSSSTGIHAVFPQSVSRSFPLFVYIGYIGIDNICQFLTCACSALDIVSTLPRKRDRRPDNFFLGQKKRNGAIHALKRPKSHHPYRNLIIWRKVQSLAVSPNESRQNVQASSAADCSFESGRSI